MAASLAGLLFKEAINPMADKNGIVEEIVRRFNLQPLAVEGGLFTQTYVSEEQIEPDHLPERYTEEHPVCTAIYYLLTSQPNSFSALHRLPTDEIYHFYLGDPTEMLLLYPGGLTQRIILGPDILHGQHVQFVAPRGVWQGTHLIAGGEFALLGTTMAPGFIPADYTGGLGAELVTQYPLEADLIRRLTR
jgi:uncharacterized protein